MSQTLTSMGLYTRVGEGVPVPLGLLAALRDEVAARHLRQALSREESPNQPRVSPEDYLANVAALAEEAWTLADTAAALLVSCVEGHPFPCDRPRDAHMAMCMHRGRSHGVGSLQVPQNGAPHRVRRT